MLSPQFTPERSIFDEFSAIEREFKETFAPKTKRDTNHKFSEDTCGPVVRKLVYDEEDKEEEPPVKKRVPVKGMGLMRKFS